MNNLLLLSIRDYMEALNENFQHDMDCREVESEINRKVSKAAAIYAPEGIDEKAGG